MSKQSAREAGGCRSAYYLSYALLSFCMCLSILYSRGYISYLIPFALPHFSTIYQVLILNLLNITMIWFTRVFLNTKLQAPKIDVMLKYTLYLEAMLCIFVILSSHYFVSNKASVILIALTLLLEISIVIYGLIYWRSQRLIFYMIGTLPFIAAALLITLQSQAIVPVNNWTSYSVLLGNAWHCFVFNFALMKDLHTISVASMRAKEQKLYAERMSHMLKVLTHDIANYSSIAYGYIYWMQKHPLDHEKNQLIMKRLERAIEGQSEILQQVRELKAVEDGKLHLDLSYINLGDILPKLLLNYSDQLQNKGLLLTLPTDAQMQQYQVFAEARSLLHSVLANFLNNAIKFSPHSSQITISLQSEADQVKILISDKGIGMDKDLASKLFSEHDATTRKGSDGESGTGFGMTIAATYMKMFGGDILIDSRPEESFPDDHGTTFILLFKGKKLAAKPIEAA